MTCLSISLLSFALTLSFALGANAGPACARRYQGRADCPELCARNWGWPGRAMGDDSWGQVMTVTVTDMDAIVTKACRVRSTVTSSATPSSTQPIANVASVPTTFLTVISPSKSAPSSSILPSTTANALLNTTTQTTLVQSSTVPSTTPVSTSTSLLPTPSTLASSTPAPSTLAPQPESTDPVSSPSPSATSPTPSPSASPDNATVDTPSPSAPLTTVTASPSPVTTPAATKTATPSTTPAVVSTSAAPKVATPSTTPVAATISTGNSLSDTTSTSDIQQYLDGHNTVRAQHGAVALTWSDEAAAKAQQWADGCVFQHSGGTLGPFGENLAAGTGVYTIADGIKAWTDEVSEYDPNNPQPSHFTQVVWKATTQVGCAVQTCNGIFDSSFGPATYYVCEYSPQGNVIGEFNENVQV